MEDKPSGPPLAAALSAHPDPALWLDAGGSVSWTNAAATARLGADRARVAAALDLAARSDRAPGSFTADVVWADGAGATAYRLSASPATAEGRLITLTPVQDLRQRAADAERLAERLEVAQEFGRVGLWERDLQTLEGHWDRYTFAFWGLDEAQGTPPFARATQAIVEEDRRGLERAFHESMRQAGAYGHRYRVRHTDGSIRHLHSQWIVFNGEDGRPQRVVGTLVDDTETWTLARSYDNALMQLAVAVDLGRIGIWRHDLETGRIHCNAVASEMMGVSAAQASYSAEELAAAVHPQDLQGLVISAEQALAQAGPVDFECRMRHADGSWRHVHTRRIVERDDLGQARAIVGVGMDVTRAQDDARRARELLRRFNLAARTAGIGHWSLEHGATRARWSEQLYAMHGLPQGSTVPTFKEWVAHHIHAQDRELVTRSYRDWAHSGRTSHELEFRILRSDGAVIHVVTHSHLEGALDTALVFGIVIDITERRAAEAALREAAERATLIARGVGLGTWEYDVITGDSVWDEQMWLLRGLQPQDEALPYESRMALLHPEDRPAARRVQELLRHDTGPLDYEFRVRWPGGGWRWIASRSIALCNADGLPVRRIGVNWDVTEARSAVAEREERLAAQREVQAKSQFLARMSHELRTPLNAVLGFTQLLLSEGDGEAADTPTRTRRLEHVRAAGQHLLSLIDDVLDLSRLEGGELTVSMQPVPLAPLVQDLLPLVEPLALEQGVSLRAGLLTAEPLADATRLRQILLNLLTNAIKYNRPGGTVTIEATAQDGVVALSVSDSGQGMTPQQMQHLFEPFNRLGAEASGVEGTGIGLAIVKALVERMDGTIHVESATGKGTRIEMRLRESDSDTPHAALRASPQAMALAATAGRVGRGGTVLYIEDNPVNTLIVGELIAQRTDLILHTADTGESGIEMARQLRPHLILLDMQLPDIDGPEVFARLQADPTLARIPCIALSANAMPADIERALRSGFADYWTKPLDFRSFMASLEALFGPGPGPVS